MPQYPSLVFCEECGRHAYVLLAENQRSIGFMTKNMGVHILESIAASWVGPTKHLLALIEEVKNSDLMDEDWPPTAEDEVLYMRVVYQDMMIQQGVHNNQFLPPCVDIQDWFPSILEIKN